MSTNSEAATKFLEDLVTFFISGSILGTIVIFLVTVLVVTFWTWFITSQVLNHVAKDKERNPTPEIQLLKAEVQQLQNQLTCMIQINNNIEKLNKTVEGMDNRIENILLSKNAPHM